MELCSESDLKHMLQEEASERRWRQEATNMASKQLEKRVADAVEAVAAVAESGAALVHQAKRASCWVVEQLRACVLDLFEALADFAERQLAWTRKASGAGVCASKRELKRWLTSQAEYDVWRQSASHVRAVRSSEGCRRMKSAARQVLLLLHPHKLSTVNRQS